MSATDPTLQAQRPGLEEKRPRRPCRSCQSVRPPRPRPRPRGPSTGRGPRKPQAGLPDRHRGARLPWPLLSGQAHPRALYLWFSSARTARRSTVLKRVFMVGQDEGRHRTLLPSPPGSTPPRLCAGAAGGALRRLGGGNIPGGEGSASLF